MLEPIKEIYDEEAEIRKWAYSDEKVEPEQDWDLWISTSRNGELLLELASDSNCPKRLFFLKCLYLLVGRHFREKPDRRTRTIRKAFNNLRELLEKADPIRDELIVSWVRQSKELLENPRAVGRFDWCEGGIARDEFKKYILLAL